MSMTELEESVRSLSTPDQKRLIALLVAEQFRREGESLPQKARRLEEEGKWVAWDDVKRDWDISDEEKNS